MKKAKAWISWSTGKDSAYSLFKIQHSNHIEPVGLFTIVSEGTDGVSMHHVPEKLLRIQANRIGLPLRVVKIPDPCPNSFYEEKMRILTNDAKLEGITQIVFGDLFLEDIRHYRELKLKPTGLKPIFPLWNEPTDILANEIISSGFKAIVTCVDSRVLSKKFVGRSYDKQFLSDLPTDVDPCAENGEFHTFIYDGPLFSSPIPLFVEGIEEIGAFTRAKIFSVA